VHVHVSLVAPDRSMLVRLMLLGCTARALVRPRAARCRAFALNARKPGVADPAALAAFVAKAGPNIIILDVRNLDFEKEPGDALSAAKASIGGDVGARPRALNVVYDRETSSMDLTTIPADWLAGGIATAPVVTHCGGGGRGEKAKAFLEKNGFGNVINGGGPEDAECWNEFGAL